jgi:hypothetical protein
MAACRIGAQTMVGLRVAEESSLEAISDKTDDDEATKLNSPDVLCPNCDMCDGSGRCVWLYCSLPS